MAGGCFFPVMLWLPAFIISTLVVNRFLLVPLLQKFDRIQEYIFVITIGWCLGCAQLATQINLSYEMGAFIAGVAMATHPISAFVAERMKPVRDFFLIMFFFSLGAGFDLEQLPTVALPACLLAAIVLLIKPWLFRWLLIRSGEKSTFSMEVGLRLGQGSEFSLLLAALAPYWRNDRIANRLSHSSNDFDHSGGLCLLGDVALSHPHSRQ